MDRLKPVLLLIAVAPHWSTADPGGAEVGAGMPDLEQFIRNVIDKEVSSVKNDDEEIQSIVLLCEETEFELCGGFLKYVNSSFTAVLPDLRDFPLNSDTAQILFIVISPDSFMRTPRAIQFSENNIWYLPKDLEDRIPLDVLRLTSKVYLYRPSSELDGAIDLWDLYSIKNHTRLKRLGTWTLEEGFGYKHVYIWDRRTNLAGVLLDTVVESNPPSSNVTVDDEGRVLSAEGLFPDIFHIMQHKMNFSFSMRTSRDRKWGSKTNGTWNGKKNLSQLKTLSRLQCFSMRAIVRYAFIKISAISKTG